VSVCLSLGANLGEPMRTIDDALRLIATTPGLRLHAVSSYWLTEPVGYINQPDFVNAAAVVECMMSPRRLLERLRSIETVLGRRERQRWHEREIDVDIILFGDVTVNEPDLKIPHPEMQSRSFVLQPLAEIAPHMMHPTLGLSIQALADGVQGGSSVRRIEHQGRGSC